VRSRSHRQGDKTRSDGRRRAADAELTRVLEPGMRRVVRLCFLRHHADGPFVFAARTGRAPITAPSVTCDPSKGCLQKTWKPSSPSSANNSASRASNRIHPEALSRVQPSDRIPASVSMTSRETASSEGAWPAASATRSSEPANTGVHDRPLELPQYRLGGHDRPQPFDLTHWVAELAAVRGTTSTWRRLVCLLLEIVRPPTTSFVDDGDPVRYT